MKFKLKIGRANCLIKMSLLSVKRIIGSKSEWMCIIPFQSKELIKLQQELPFKLNALFIRIHSCLTMAKDMFLNGKLGLYSPGNFLFYGCRYHLFYNRLSLSIYFWHGLSLSIYFWHFNFYFQITTIKHAHSRSYGLISSTTLRSPQKSLMVYSWGLAP